MFILGDCPVLPDEVRCRRRTTSSGGLGLERTLQLPERTHPGWIICQTTLSTRRHEKLYLIFRLWYIYSFNFCFQYCFWPLSQASSDISLFFHGSDSDWKTAFQNGRQLPTDLQVPGIHWDGGRTLLRHELHSWLCGESHGQKQRGRRTLHAGLLSSHRICWVLLVLFL